MTSTNVATYLIPINLVDEAKRRIERAIKQAGKLGKVWEPTLEVGKPVAVSRGDGSVSLRMAINVTLPEITLTEWRIIGRGNLLSEGRDGNAVITRLYNVGIPAEAWHVSDKCDHCGWVRQRKIVYILQNVKDSKIIRVGSSCLAEFVNVADMGLVSAMEALVVWGEDTAHETREGRMTEPARYLVSEFLALATEIADTVGYVRQKDHTDARPSTVALTWAAWRQRANIAISQRSQEHALVCADWCMENVATEYERNLQAVYVQIALTQEELVRHSTLIVSAYAAFKSFGEGKFHAAITGWQKRRDSGEVSDVAPQAPGYVGNVGNRMQLLVRLTRTFTYENRDGDRKYGHVFHTNQGNQLVWFGSSRLDMSEGSEGTIVATVVRHSISSYDKRPETIVNRVRLGRSTAA